MRHRQGLLRGDLFSFNLFQISPTNCQDVGLHSPRYATKKRVELMNINHRAQIDILYLSDHESLH
jgi:hypothetical protein